MTDPTVFYVREPVVVLWSAVHTHTQTVISKVRIESACLVGCREINPIISTEAAKNGRKITGTAIRQ